MLNIVHVIVHVIAKRIKASRAGRYALLFPLLLLLLVGSVHASTGEDKPHDSIYSWQILSKVYANIFNLSKFRIIGTCWWYHGWVVSSTLEEEYWYPDFIVTVANNKDSNPYFEVSKLDDLYYKAGSKEAQTLGLNSLGIDMGEGQVSNTGEANQGIGMISRVVNVYGMLNLGGLGLFQLNQDTQPLTPYYNSYIDTGGRYGVAELLKYQSYNIFGNAVGTSFLSKWDYEFPRSMDVQNDNRYIASALAAQRAADIVSNISPMHTYTPVANSCGQNCAVTNVIEQNPDAPQSSLGSDAEKAGNGNYVFVVWRHYKGCVQSAGKLFFYTEYVPVTKPR